MLPSLKKNKATYGWAGTGRGMTFCDKRENGGWTNPRFRVQQAEGLRTKALQKRFGANGMPRPAPAHPKSGFV